MAQTILYIEDHEANADLVKAIAENEGYSVLIAYSGQKGIEMAIEHLPDLIICDYHLPYMNGHEIIRALRGDDKTKAIPIMMLTADLYSYPQSVDLGIDDYLNKPIRRNMFLSRVNRILNPDSNPNSDSDDSPQPL